MHMGGKENSLAVLVFINVLPRKNVVDEVFVTHETETHAVEQFGEVLLAIRRLRFDPSSDSFKYDLLVANVKLVVAQNGLELVAIEILELRALVQYLLEIMADILPAFVLEIPTEIVSSEFEDSCVKKLH